MHLTCTVLLTARDWYHSAFDTQRDALGQLQGSSARSHEP